MNTFCYAKTVAHKKAILKWLASQRRTAVQWYEDKSGLKKTPERDQMLTDLAKSTRITVIVYSLDQLTRSFHEGLTLLAGLFLGNHRIVAVSPQVDIAGSAAADLLLAIAQMEKNARREQQASGIKEAKARGVYTGRKKGALKPGNYVPRVLELREQGLTYESIAAELGLSRATVIRYLKISQAPSGV